MMVEVLVSSALLSLIVVMSLNSFTDSMRALSKASAKDRRMAEIHVINENVRHQVSKWRRSDGWEYGLNYNVDESVCGDDMASTLLREMPINTPNTLVADGHLIISKNEGFTDAVIYLPQSGWCP